ncbi:hypothetical protein A2415_03105 [candidate division WWE3 bacterium RIFOXYC1_FULL_39_7]|uniref:Nucleoside 2-deoxyribosyltransferase n=2 Tax=Katanobacteria TaxID=422282 RepID=A0A1F4X8N7_UNCKA|nr:MAG: hypothetical protein A2415_03105 [candidate division WWE3 bacterium RIFOXYC1_FULL_39_7]OGC78018.1 MAG: hypothetical protein A2619_02955 [candidate division WWE3 bacterium RIFOXYD1_FULL_39_9]
MKCYIGYKFSNIADKQDLKMKVLSLAEHIISTGNTTFVLGRDVQNWHSSPFPMLKTLPHVFINMFKCDCLISLVTDNSTSTGLLVENILATLLMKKRGFLVVNPVNKHIYNFLSDPEFTLIFNNDEELPKSTDILLDRLKNSL